jgi:hypothetical protein
MYRIPTGSAVLSAPKDAADSPHAAENLFPYGKGIQAPITSITCCMKLYINCEHNFRCVRSHQLAVVLALIKSLNDLLNSVYLMDLRMAQSGRRLRLPCSLENRSMRDPRPAAVFLRSDRASNRPGLEAANGASENLIDRTTIM